MLSLLKKGITSIAAGRGQASLGLQSPHLPNAITRVGRFLYVTTAGWIALLWYTGYVNERTSPGMGPQLVLPGRPVVNSPDRPDRNAPFPTSITGASAPGGVQGSVATSMPGSSKAGGFLPRNALYVPGRHDQGRDGRTTPGAPIIAPGAGRVIRVASDPRGFGSDYPIVKFSSGPYAGRILYIGHTHSALHPGTVFRAGQVLSYTGKTAVGNASVPGWFEIGFADTGSPGPLGQPAPF